MVILWAVISANAQSGGGYVITKSSIDGGGVTFHTGGGYRLGGTVGQHDAGNVAGGSYVLHGGFWPSSPSAPDVGNDSCIGGSNNGQSCGQHAECPGGFCGMKNRFLSLQIPATATGHGVRVTLADLDANSVADPSAYNGQTRWAGTPSLDVSDGVSGTFHAAALQCAFHAQDWSGVGMLHVYGSAVVPGSSYDVQVCASASGSCSVPLRIGTAKWGDIVPPLVTTQPNFQDIVSIVDKFQNKPTGPSKTRTKLREPVDPNAAVGFLEVSADVDAFKGKTYKQIFPTVPVTCP